MRKTVYIALGTVGLTVAGCAILQDSPRVSDGQIRQELLSSFQDKGQAKLERVQQTALQEACSVADSGKPLPESTRAAIEKAALSSVKFPADGQYLGDWKSGEKIAQTGTGFQFSDKAGDPAGGNCYACHQLAPQELAYGNIGPSLYNYAKLRGNSEETMKYTWAKIWNSHAYNACSVMPRFGDAGILTEAQIKDVMALLMSPDSPVNK
ncbi:sulfur oxidation c-type cytochrome SoxX [Limnobacter humi]